MEKGLIGITPDLYNRVGYLLSIHKALQKLYPQNSELLYGWVKMRNTKLDGCTPLEVMIKEDSGIAPKQISLQI